jgi:hypothetical protein
MGISKPMLDSDYAAKVGKAKVAAAAQAKFLNDLIASMATAPAVGNSRAMRLLDDAVVAYALTVDEYVRLISQHPNAYPKKPDYT